MSLNNIVRVPDGVNPAAGPSPWAPNGYPSRRFAITMRWIWFVPS